jgi:hypothetical protein
VRLWIHDGSNARLFDEIPIPALTPSATVPAYRATRIYQNLVLENAQSLRGTTEKTETFNIHCEAYAL